MLYIPIILILKWFCRHVEPFLTVFHFKKVIKKPVFFPAACVCALAQGLAFLPDGSVCRHCLLTDKTDIINPVGYWFITSFSKLSEIRPGEMCSRGISPPRRVVYPGLCNSDTVSAVPGQVVYKWPFGMQSAQTAWYTIQNHIYRHILYIYIYICM